MNIGLFTDTYFPQISGVATSIQTLKNALEEQGHSVFIFTTTDPHLAKGIVEPNVFRLSSVPFISFTDRRIAFRGLFQATKIAKEVKLDVVHTQTEFSMGAIGKYVAHNLKIPAIHTYHTMYQDYLHYILYGHLLKPYHVIQFCRAYLHNIEGVIAPSLRVKDTLRGYGVKIPLKVIPTGVDLKGINETPKRDVRKDLGLKKNDKILLTLSRIAPEKKINNLLDIFPIIKEKHPTVKLVVVGDGPDLKNLKNKVKDMKLEDSVLFTGSVEHSDVGNYYAMADLFVSASDTETQGLTYIEAMAAGTPSIVYDTEYTEQIFNHRELGAVFNSQQQMVELIDKYLNKVPFKIPNKLLEEKLEEVSAATFAKNVVNFYQEAINKLSTTEVLND